MLMRQEGLLQKRGQELALTTQRFNKGFAPLKTEHGRRRTYKSLAGRTAVKTEQKHKRDYKSATGFTLFEILLATAIFGLAACGNLSLYISCARLAESAGNITSMMNRAREELENNIWSTDFETLGDYFLLPPDVPDGTSLVCYVQDQATDLKQVRIVISYRERSNRIIGGDKDLDGVVSAGDDINNNGELISPCEIVTFIARKE